MDDSVAVTLQVTQALEALAIPYFIGGSLAGIIYGEYRTTQDTDLVAAIQPMHIAPLVAHLSPAFYIQATDIQMAIEDAQLFRDAPQIRPSFNCIHLATGFKIDIFVPTYRPFEQAEFDRRVIAVLAQNPERTAAVVTAEDAILAKLEWYQLSGSTSSQQWRDVVAMLKIQGDQLDTLYLGAWAERLGVADLLAQACLAAS